MAVVHEGEPVLQVRQQVTEKPFSQAAGLFQCTLRPVVYVVYTTTYDLAFLRLGWFSTARQKRLKDPDATYLSVVFIMSNLSLPAILGGLPKCSSVSSR